MTDEQFTNLLQLQLRNAIASKEACIAQANREAALDGWKSNWASEIRSYDVEIQGLIAACLNR